MTKHGPHGKALTTGELDRQGLLDALAEVFDTPEQMTELLDRIDFPRGRRPNQGSADAVTHWRALCRLVETGLTDGGLEALLAAAAHLREFNPAFRPWARRAEGRPAPLTNDEARQGSSLFIQTARAATDLLARIQELAGQVGTPGPVDLAVTNDRGLAVFDLPQASGEQAQNLANAVRSELLRADPHARVGMGNNAYRDTVLRQLFMEGPDSARFELNDVPASTTPRELGRALMHQYADAKFWPRDPATSQPREVVLDLVNPDGSSRRLEPDKPIGRQDVQERSSISGAPRSTAGGINPVLRNEAIARVRLQVLTFARGHPGVEVQANYPDAPTEYLLRFAGPSFGPPAPGEVPYPIDRHEVFLLLPPEFPIQAPQAYWQTPIYHPNIHRKNGAVCLGELADHYRPGRDMGEVCQMLIDIARYNNYQTREGYNLDAQRWAVSPEGQAAIVRRGGASLEQMRARADGGGPPPSFRIRRVDA